MAEVKLNGCGKFRFYKLKGASHGRTTRIPNRQCIKIQFIVGSVVFLTSFYMASYFLVTEIFYGRFQADLIKVRLFREHWQLVLYKPIYFLESILHDPRHGEIYAQRSSGASLPGTLDNEHIHFILPNHHQGDIRVDFDKSARSPSQHNGYKVCYVKENGIAAVNDLSPYFDDYSFTACYQNGNAVPFKINVVIASGGEN